MKSLTQSPFQSLIVFSLLMFYYSSPSILGQQVINGYTIEPDAFLINADLSGADLTGTNLTGADLRYTNLTDAILIGTDLTDADLSSSDWTNANLTDAILTGARGCKFYTVCMRGALHVRVHTNYTGLY